jgi:hypothetical protein
VALLAIAGLLLFAAVGAAGCTSDEPSDNGTTNGGSSENGSDDPSGGDSTSDGELSADDEEAAIDIAQAYFVAQTDFTSDQFEWTLEAAVQADDGTWYARVSATPTGDAALETEQIYVYAPADSEAGFWFALDMGTGIDPESDDRFPEQVRGALQP